MGNFRRLMVFSGTTNEPLAEEICKELREDHKEDVELGKVNIAKFSNENISVQFLETVREADVFVVQSLYPRPNESLVELMLLCDALRSASAWRITAVIPHYSYARSDKKDKPRISIAARLIADVLITAGANRFLLMTLHSEQVRGFFNVPTDHLQSTKRICAEIKKMAENGEIDLSNTVALFDLGQDKRRGNFSENLGIDYAVINKHRLKDTEVDIKGDVVGDVKDKDVIMFDDEISSGTSMKAIVKKLTEQHKVRSVRAVFTHGLFAGNAVKYIEEMPLEQVITTNTVHVPKEKLIDKIKVISVAPDFAEAINRIHHGQSIGESGLFD
ncbi:ribose-phosphate diphosphokinase [Candidatus Poribacteria bacterium]|nr:ribose-phosphate diphosphokinase [Candidatus Poribacteria bacterium]